VQALRRFDQLLPADGEPKYEVINLGTGNGTTVKEFVEAFNAVAPTPLRVRETGPRPGDVVGSYTRIDKARAALDWEPRYTIADGIRDSMRWSAVRDSKLDG
jgi:UDP-glucose 4-epimerase